MTQFAPQFNKKVYSYIANSEERDYLVTTTRFVATPSVVSMRMM